MRARRTAKVTSAPAAEPVSLAEAKAWAKIDSSDADALLVALIAAARESAENYTRRSLLTQTVRLTLDLPCSGLNDALGEGVYDLPSTELYGALPRVIELPKGPVQSVTSVTTYNTANASSVYSSSYYSLNSDGTRLVLTESAVWPSPLRPVAACEIVYLAGYGDGASSVPQAVRTALLMHVQRMYDGRVFCEMPEGCTRLLRPYRIMDSLAYG
jgi:hypothetical protein